MKVSLPGVLLRSAAICKKSRDSSGLEHILQQLLDNLTELASKKDTPDALASLNEFFNIWIVKELGSDRNEPKK